MHWTTPPDPLLAIRCIQVETHVNALMGEGPIILKPHGRTHSSGYVRVFQQLRQYLLKEEQIVCTCQTFGQQVRPDEVVFHDAGSYIY